MILQSSRLRISWRVKICLTLGFPSFDHVPNATKRNPVAEWLSPLTAIASFRPLME